MTPTPATFALALTLALLACSTPKPVWVGTWSASPQDTDEPQRIDGATIREVVRVSVGGHRVRLRLSNVFGTKPVTLSAVHVALMGRRSTLVDGSDRTVKFHGSATLTLSAHEEQLSDDIDLEVPAFSDLAVSFAPPAGTALETEHSVAMATTFISGPGDFTSAPTFAPAETTQSLYLLSDVEVGAAANSRAVVVLGDSLSDGVGSTLDTNHRWPNLLARRLAEARGMPPTAVLDEGIGGNRMLHEFVGASALERLDRDVLSKAGVRYVIVLEGLNDFGIPGAFDRASEKVTAEALIAAHQELVRRIHAKGLKAYGGTLMPFEGAAMPGYYSAEGEAARQAVNAWLRTSKVYDAVIDFDAVVREPAQPSRLRVAFDSGDHLHPNDAGYQAMADAVELGLFR